MSATVNTRYFKQTWPTTTPFPTVTAASGIVHDAIDFGEPEALKDTQPGALGNEPSRLPNYFKFQIAAFFCDNRKNFCAAKGRC